MLRLWALAEALALVLALACSRMRCYCPCTLHALCSMLSCHSTALDRVSSTLLQDVLSICGNNLPAWMGTLVSTCRFLFPFHLRRCFFYCTSFGFARALWHLQHQQAAEGTATAGGRESREFRVGRLQRQKVCLSQVLIT